ncbi:hypothetical protein K7X08_013678 [Anisodus acutangulus]|uniref:FAE domain-containing protein n=1 Tax=Anisodus acutangulus TaxID=402998 RepID=A0A9Q1R4A9_9SOLA|nr:hypothetical protein K7X08_013678 [Anisodus acutangulus]
MRNIYLKSGLGDETYGPPFIFEDDNNNMPTLQSANQEAQEGIFSSIDDLLAKTLIDPQSINVVIVACGAFSPSPSLSSLIMNRYKLKPDVKTYNLSGMGCSSGVLSIDFAARVLRGSRKVQNALVVITENITLNWYNGENRSMLVTNCIFRVGCAAAIVSNNPKLFEGAKMELVHSLRTHHGADDSAYRAAFQEEDDKGITGVSLTKDLIRVAGINLRQHIKILGLRVLPLTQLTNFAYSIIMSTILSQGKSKPVVPDFTTAFEHMCIHTGGKAVIEQVGRVLKLNDEVTEPARMTLNRFDKEVSSVLVNEHLDESSTSESQSEPVSTTMPDLVHGENIINNVTTPPDNLPILLDLVIIPIPEPHVPMAPPAPFIPHRPTRNVKSPVLHKDCITSSIPPPYLLCSNRV